MYEFLGKLHQVKLTMSVNNPHITRHLQEKVEMPDPPKQSFFKGFFGGGVRQLDRDELFGEASSGKAFSSTAQVTTGENMRNMTVFSFFKLKIFLFKSWEV